VTDVMDGLTDALTAASAILRARYGGALAISTKMSDLDLVTIADKESEAAIKALLAARFPTHAILAEESGGDRSEAAGEHRWIVDPLDGTTNFAHGFPMFSVSIAFERNGEVVAAGVENPFYGERFLAEQGAGATLNEKPIHVSSTNGLSTSLTVTGFPYDRRERLDHYLAILGEFLKRAHGVLRIGSAALDLCAVASGRVDVFWEEHLAPWDTAAGALIVTEAGGRVTTFDGGRFDPFGKAVLATNRAVHDEAIAAIASVTRWS
jgi:myo-inositol-1(or 4)-monophosphatase